jgi:SMI1/KNR4 family protein SUKH-1
VGPESVWSAQYQRLRSPVHKPAERTLTKSLPIILRRVWRDLADELGLASADPASEEDIAAAESAVGCELPDDLRALLDQTDGLGDGLVLSAGEIAQVNLDMRTTRDFAELYMPFEPLLFFGAEGNGDLYAFRILAGDARSTDVFVWDHESDSRTATAFGLERYVRGERWHTGD